MIREGICIYETRHMIPLSCQVIYFEGPGEVLSTCYPTKTDMYSADKLVLGGIMFTPPKLSTPTRVVYFFRAGQPFLVVMRLKCHAVSRCSDALLFRRIFDLMYCV